MNKKKVLKPGSVDGRPRFHNREKIASDLIEWARKDDSINFNKFAAHYSPIFPVSKLHVWAKEDENFRIAYECAKSFLAYRREEWLNADRLHVKAFDMNATVYDVLLKHEREENATFDASLRKELDTKPTEIHLRVSNDGLGTGLSISTEKISNTIPKSIEQRN